ncbi:MAG: transcription antitermination factor NusB, partial [Opitutales bacterium]|nr:transcription antitermination factor NusB [Opitutales bacterium]
NRRLAVQILYAWDLNPCIIRQQLKEYINDLIENYGDEPPSYYRFASELSIGAIENQDVIDALIQKHTQNWQISRIAKVDLAILRIATYEMLFREDIPPVVSMNEAIELGKELASDESSRFLNGVLDNMRSEIDRPARTPVKPQR